MSFADNLRAATAGARGTKVHKPVPSVATAERWAKIEVKAEADYPEFAQLATDAAARGLTEVDITPLYKFGTEGVQPGDRLIYIDRVAALFRNDGCGVQITPDMMLVVYWER